MNEEQREAAASDPIMGTPEAQLEELVASAAKANLFLEVLEKALAPPISDETFEEITRAGGALMGKESLTLILNAASRHDGERIPELGFSEAASNYLLRIVSLYGGALRQALHASTVPASRGADWRSFTADSFIDLRDKRPLLDMEIEKFNGEKLRIRGSLTSTLTLLENILLAALTVEDMSEVAPDQSKRMQDLLNELRSRLSVPGDGPATQAAGTTTETSQ